MLIPVTIYKICGQVTASQDGDSLADDRFDDKSSKHSNHGDSAVRRPIFRTYNYLSDTDAEL